MKTILAILLSSILTQASLAACVTYHPSTGNYTVSPSGCVNHKIDKSQPTTKRNK